MPMTPQPDKKKSSYQQELERRSNDLLRVYNPLTEDYIIEWDKKNGTKLFRVPSKEEAVFPRYIAEKYLREMFDKIVITDAMDAVKKENERRVKSGMAVMDKTLKTGEQEQFESKFYIGNDDRAREILSILYMGVETEFGIDRQTPQQENKKDPRPAFEQAMETVQSEKDNGISPTISNVRPAVNGYACDFPGCDFVAKEKIGLIGHKRSHRKDSVVNKKDENTEENIDAKKQAAAMEVSQ